MKALSNIEKLKLYGTDFDQKLESVLIEINNKYGDILFEELMNRIDLTIKNFQEEMGSITSEFEKSKEPISRISDFVKIQQSIKTTDSSHENIPEWEKRLNNN